MNFQDRLALNLGRLILQIEEKQAAIDDLMSKFQELEKENTDLKAALDTLKSVKAAIHREEEE